MRTSYKISIVIPTCNRKESLAETLTSIYRQSYPKEWIEVIVVDDGSDVDLTGLVDEFKVKGLNIKYVKQKKRGPAAARNLGIKISQAPLIGFTDDDCILDNNWVEGMVKTHFENTDVDIVGGFTWVDKNNLKAVVSQFLANGAMTAVIDGKSQYIFFPTCNVSIKRRVFQKEVFNERFPYPAGEDLEFFWRLYKSGYKFLFNKRAYVYHNRIHNFFTHLRQSYLYGKGNFLVKEIFPEHPALQEIDDKNWYRFSYSILKGLLLSPLFSLRLAYRLGETGNIKGDFQTISAIFYFWLHKIFYFLGVFNQKINDLKKIRSKE